MTILRLVLFVLIAFVPAVFGGLFGPGEWYRGLAKPSWTPPGWLFGPVWTLLYLMIGISGFLAWGAGSGRQRSVAFAVFAVQLLLNGLWSFFFFGLHRRGSPLLRSSPCSS